MISITMMSHLRWLSPLWCLTAPPSRPAGKRVTRFSGRFAPLRIVFPCHRGIGRATKGKRLYGQARRLSSPDLHIPCRMCTVDNKAPQSNPFTQRIAKNKVPPPGGRWWRQPPKGVHFPRPQGGCKGFIIRGRLLSIHRRPPQPSAAKPLSNLRTLGAIAPSSFRTLKPVRACPYFPLSAFLCYNIDSFESC